MIIFLVILLIIALMALIFVAANYNALVDLSNKEKEAFATMDVYLKKRWDLIPNIVETVKGYAKHEKETLEDIVRLRNMSYDNSSTQDKIDANQKIHREVSKVMMLAESYPDLKANENFKELNQELSKIEQDIANARKYYNAVIKNYNNKVQMFPSSIIASMFGYKEKSFFEINSIERENVKVSF